MSSFPQEIIEEVLYRLLAKTIGRCRCVSKAWLALLTEPNFIKSHLKQSLKQPTQSLFLISVTEALFSVPLGNAHQLFDEVPKLATKINIPNKTDDWDKVIASCDELVLVSFCNRWDMWLINPTTRVFRVVPPSPFDVGPNGAFSMFGMGYDKVGDDYKVVTFGCFPTNIFSQVNLPETFGSVYSVRSGAWRRVYNSPYYYQYVGCASTWVFVDGCLHWIVLEDTGSKITAFNLSDEKFYEVPAPSSLAINFAFEYVLGVLGGCLCMSFSEVGREKIDIWVMKEYGVKESWTKFTIANPEGVTIRPVWLLGEEQVLLVKGRKLVMYDMKEGMMKDFMVNGVPCTSFASMRCCVTFIESLVSLSQYHDAVTHKKPPALGLTDTW